MCPEGRNDSPKDIVFQSFDLILDLGEGLHVVSPLLLIPWKYISHHLSLSTQYLGLRACKYQISYHNQDLN
jgi:hypothetical protein